MSCRPFASLMLALAAAALMASPAAAQTMAGATCSPPPATPSTDVPALMRSAADLLRSVPVSQVSQVAGALETAADCYEGRWVSRTSGPFTLIVDVSTFKTAMLVVDANLPMPLRGSLGLTGTEIARPIFVYSKADSNNISFNDLPQRLRTVVASTYYNQQSFTVQKGTSIFGLLRFGGIPAGVMNKLVGAPLTNGRVELAARWGYGPTSSAEPPEPSNPGDAMRNWLTRYKADYEARMQEESGVQAPTKELQLQFWMPPTVRWSGPLGMNAVQISDADVTWSSLGTIAFIGNLHANGKRILANYAGPYSIVQKLAALQKPSDAVELADVLFMASTPPTYTLKDHADLMKALIDSIPIVPIPSPVLNSMQTLATPLSLFGIQNPVTQPGYTTGSPLPPWNAFNVRLVGPLATFDEKKGPLVGLVGTVNVLTRPFGSVNVSLSESGLYARVAAGLGLPLGLGTLASATALVDISSSKQEISLTGPVGVPNVPGSPTLRVNFSASALTASVGGDCYPLKLETGVRLADVSTLSNLLGGLSPSINNGEVCAREVVKTVCGSSGVGAVPGMGGVCGAAGNTLVTGAYTVVNTFSSSIHSVAGYINDAVNALKNVFAPDGKSLWQQAQEATGVGFVQLKNSASQLCLDVLDRNMGNGASIIQYRCEYRPNKFFYYDPVARRPGFGKLRINHSNKCLDVPQNRTDQGVRLIQFNCNDTDNQLWQRDSNRKWRPFHAQHMCLHVEGGAEGAPAVLRNCQDNNGLQQFDGALMDPWMDQAVDARYYLSAYPDLRAAFGDPNNANAQARAVDHWRKFGMREGRQGRADFHIGHYIQRNGHVQPGGPVGTGQPISNAMEARNEYAVWHWINWGQWSSRRASPSFGPLVPVHSAGANMCLAIEGNNGNNGQRLIMFNCNGGANQGFFFAHRGDGWGQLMARNSAKCIGIGAASMTPGAAAIQWDCNDSHDQQWRYEITSPGRGVYRNRNSNLCLDVAASGMANGTAVVQWECHGRANQALVEPPRPR